MWEFTEIREKAIAALNPQRELSEKIFLGAQYGIVDWLRDGYTEMVRQPTLTIENIRGPPFPVTWETAAKLFCTRERLLSSSLSGNYNCCGGYFGPSYWISPNPRHCTCRTAAVVDEVFNADFEAMKGNPISSGPPLPTDTEPEPTSKKKGKKKF